MLKALLMAGLFIATIAGIVTAADAIWPPKVIHADLTLTPIQQEGDRIIEAIEGLKGRLDHLDRCLTAKMQMCTTVWELRTGIQTCVAASRKP